MGFDGFDDWPEGVRRPITEDLAHGAIVGVTDIVDVVERRGSKWYFPGNFGFVLANARALKKPILCTGSLSFWKVPARVVRTMASQGMKVTPGRLISPADVAQRGETTRRRRR